MTMKLKNENSFECPIVLNGKTIFIPASSTLETVGILGSKLPSGVNLIQEVIGEIDPIANGDQILLNG